MLIRPKNVILFWPKTFEFAQTAPFKLLHFGQWLFQKVLWDPESEIVGELVKK